MEYEVKQLLNPYIYNDILSITNGDIDFTRFKNKTVLITGAGQLLGFYLACAFLINSDLNNTNTKVIAVDKSDVIFKKYGKLTFRNDIDFAVSNTYSDLQCDKADFVIHTESYVGLNNNSAISNLLDYIKTSSASAVINTYSDIYGDVYNGKSKISEEDIGYTDCSNPACHSIQSQRMAETFALKFAKDNNIDIKLSRLCTIYGPWEFNGNSSYINILSNALQKHNLLVGPNDCKTNSLCYVTDAASALLKILLNGESFETYNISAGYSASTKDFAEECVKIFSDYDIKVIYKGKSKETHLSPMSPTKNILDNTKILSLGFTPKVDLQMGIVRSAKIMAENK